MSPAQPLAIHIVTWNAARYLPNLFLSLDAQSTRAFTVTVVDNASSDGTGEWLSEHRPDVTMLRNFRNQGFSRGHNQAIALTRSRWEGDDLAHRYVLVTNADVEFAPDAIEQLHSFMEAHPEVSSCCPKLLRATFTDASEGGVRDVERTDVIDAVGIGITKARRAYDRGAGERDTGQYDADTRVFGPSGACALYRASVLQTAMIDGEVFDETFFAYQEDVDLAWRMRLLGLECQTVPQSRVWHHRRAKGLGKPNWFRAWVERMRKPSAVNFLSTRNHGWVILKNDDPLNLFWHAPWWVPYECAKLLASLCSWAQFKGQWASCMGIPAILRKRAQVMRRATVSGKAMRGWFV